MRKIIFYFSGTGNSLTVSNLISSKLEETEVVPFMQIEDYNLVEYNTIGLIFPVYYIHAPEIVLQRLKNIKFKCLSQVFVVAVYGGSWGYALSDVRHEIMKSSKVNIQEFRVRMPGNHILEYGAFPLFFQNLIIKRAIKQVDEIGDIVMKNEITKPIEANLLARLFRKNGNKIKTFSESGRKFHTNDNCKHCGICVKICPVKNIIFVNNDNDILWNDKCQRCMACIQWCPHNGISHPDFKEGRRRYTCPSITLEDMWREK